MHISKMIIMTLIFGLLGQYYAFADQPFRLEAIEQFTRDTVLVGPRESVTIGFVPEHLGIWLTHCHIQEHAEAGMMTTIEVKN